MPYEFLRVHVDDRVGWLEYHRPPVNAFNWEMLREVGPSAPSSTPPNRSWPRSTAWRSAGGWRWS